MSFIWNSENVYMDGELYNQSKKTYRYCLIGNKKAKKPLIVVGLNPSTADNEKPDPTMRRVISFMESNGYDGFLMINLYPLRTPSPKELKKYGIDKEIHQLNLQKIQSYLKNISNPNVLLGFGSKILYIPELKKCFKDIVSTCNVYKVNWLCLKKTKAGHPSHPLYLKRNLKLVEFDVENYLKQLECI